jgi:NAD-dependent dihydropyrimidine dehydrogenase PreA subunit
VPETFFDYSADGGWDKAVEKCNGMAVCRKLDAGTMCPSYMVTLEEEHSTRGRANALREAMRGNLPGMKSKEVLEALDLCLECKACKTECPVGVDMARYKASSWRSTTAPRHAARPRTSSAASTTSRGWAARAPRLANLGALLGGAVIKRVARGPAPRAAALAREPFRRWFRRRAPRRAGGAGGRG